MPRSKSKGHRSPSQASPPKSPVSKMQPMGTPGGSTPTGSPVSTMQPMGTPGGSTPTGSPVSTMQPMGTPGESSPYAGGMSASTVSRRITGHAEKADYSKVPSFNEICFNGGKALAQKKIIDNIDEWITNQIERGVDIKVTEQTLVLRNQWAGTNYTLDKWEQNQKSEEGEGRESICDACIVSLRL